ncbi:Fungal pheromone mating factor STE2 GPCR domain containing protein [Elaphomyces granulatus]
MAAFDPYSQNLTFHMADGTPFNVSVAELDAFFRYNFQMCVIDGSQLGASIILAIVLCVVTRPENRRSPVFILNNCALILNVIRLICDAVYFNSAFNEVYAYFSNDFSSVPPGAYANSILAVIVIILLLICVEASLILQAQIVCANLRRLYRRSILGASILVALVPIGLHMGMAIENAIYILNATDFSSFVWLQSAKLIALTISVCFFSAIFFIKLAYAIRQRERLGVRKFQPMRVICIMSFQTMIIPVVFLILQFCTPVPGLLSCVYTVVAISLPLSSVWAASTRRSRAEPSSNAAMQSKSSTVTSSITTGPSTQFCGHSPTTECINCGFTDLENANGIKVQRQVSDHHDSNQTYHDPNRTYRDVASLLAQYPSFSPRTDVYTSENGVSMLLLHLVGTLPVSFRGTVYRFPLNIWVPNTYPREPPIVYVTPTQDMVVRVGQHVTLEGRVYHHYLAHWVEAWDRSSVVDLLSILREVFAKEPPVKYKQSQNLPPQQPLQAPAPPPPLPPLPPELGPSSHTPPKPPSQEAPPPPPKSDQAQGHEQLQLSAPQLTLQTSPSLPPLPPKAARQSLSPQIGRNGWSNHSVPGYSPQRSGIPVTATASQETRQPQPPSVPPKPSYQQEPTYTQDGRAIPTSPLRQTPASPIPGPPQTVPYYGPPPQLSTLHCQRHDLRGRLPYRQPPGPQKGLQQQQYHLSLRQQLLNRPAPVQTIKPETPDLLTSPFELELPSVLPSSSPPPIPPNPEKDALLHTLSRTLTDTLQSNVSQARSAVQPLQSQSKALHDAMTTLQNEITALDKFQSTFQSNISILQQSIHHADAVIADAQARISAPPQSSSDLPLSPAAISGADARGNGLPAIDDVLVAPTVVGKQLYDLVADERGIQQAIYALQAALVKGVIGVELWSRHTRSLAREAFIKRALIRKIGRGMGLEGNE